MTNEQIAQATALLIAMFIGLLPNIVLKLLDKYKSKEEIADIEVDTLSEALKTMREHNDFLEKKLSTKREEITTQNKMMYDLNSQNVILTTQNLELTAKVSEMTTRLLEITTKLQECMECVDNMKKENGE